MALTAWRPISSGQAQQEMCAVYSHAYEVACGQLTDASDGEGKVGRASEAFDRIAALPEKLGKVAQPGGSAMGITDLFTGALGAIGELWAFGQRAIAASGEAGVAASWGIKKPRRIWFKLNVKYDGDVSQVNAERYSRDAGSVETCGDPMVAPLSSPDPPPDQPPVIRQMGSFAAPRTPFSQPCPAHSSRARISLISPASPPTAQVTDCARISLIFATAAGLERAALFVLSHATTFKNRVAHPTDEHYRDLMFTVPMAVGQTGGTHVCEVQLHIAEMMSAKSSGAGHRMYKVWMIGYLN